MFGPIGESLTWLRALDELLKDADPTYAARRDGHPEGCVIPGLRWARNLAVHGVTVMEMVGVIPGAQPGLMRLGLSQLGSVQSCHWSGRVALPPPGRPQHPDTERSYDQHVGGKPLKTPLVVARVHSSRPRPTSDAAVLGVSAQRWRHRATGGAVPRRSGARRRRDRDQAHPAWWPPPPPSYAASLSIAGRGGIER